MTGQDRTEHNTPPVTGVTRNADGNDSITHAPAQEKEPPTPSREWIVQSEWTMAYEATYGHPPVWRAKGDGEAARRVIGYLQGLADKKKVVLDDEMLRRGVAKASQAYLATKTPALEKQQHPFEWLSNDLHVYLHARART